MDKSKKRSPLKARPLRNPGESLDYMIQDKRDDFTIYYFAAVIFIIMAMYDWIRWLQNTLPNPISSTILVLIIVTYCYIKIRKTKREIRRLEMARDGEKAVGQFLSSLQKEGASVLHDIVGDQFNVDHVVISRRGIFVVETKTFSKPLKGKAKIRVEGERLLVNEMEVERNPLVQARAASRWITELLQESTGKKFPAKPVILFPGWYVEKMNGKSDVWVLNPKALPAFIKNEPIRLSDPDMHLATYHLSRYIRMQI